MASKKPHIVIVPLPAVGHTTPMMHLSSYLSKQGCSITFVILSGGTLPVKELIERGQTWPPTGSDITLVEFCSSAPIPDRPPINNGKLDLTYAHVRARGYAHDLENFVKDMEGQVSLLLSDYQLSWVTEVATKLNIPAAFLFTGSARWSWFDFNMTDLFSENLVPETDELLSEEEDTVICQDPLLRRSDIPWHFWNARDFQEFTITYNIPTWEKAKWILINTCEPLEQGMLEVMTRELGTKFLPVGPLFLVNEDRASVGLDPASVRQDPTPDSLTDPLKWLDKQEDSSILYIALGSSATFTVQQREEFAFGLKASKQKFLWVVPPPWDGDSCRNILDGTDGIIVPWSPQVQVLSHPAVGGFVTHCGWNSTLEGVTNGQPMMCWPCFFDQYINARLIVDEWKVGVWLTKKGGTVLLDRTEVEGMIMLVMQSQEGKDMGTRAKELSCLIRRSVHENGKLQTLVEQL